jgi:hypothetical protein
MNGYNFTERVRKTLMFSREEASRLHHEYVGTEHLLLGLLREGEGVASTVIASRNIDPDAIRAKVEEIIKAGSTSNPTGPDLPYTSRAKKVLEFSMLAARDLEHAYVGTEHILLGLLREEKGVGGQVLMSFGLTLDNARAEVLAILGTDPSKAERGAVPGVSIVRDVFFPARPGARLLLTVSAALAWAIGGMLIFNPAGFEAPMGIVVDDKIATIAQAQGAILVGLGFINWLGRGVSDRSALIAIMYGNFVVQALSFSIVLRALVRGLIPMSGIGALAMHVVLGAAFAWKVMELRRAGRRSTVG